MNKKEYPVSGILAAGLLIAALLGVMGIFYQSLQEKLFTQAVNNLVVTTQSDKLYFDQIIQNRLYWLETIAEISDVPDAEGQENWQKILNWQSVDGMRFGVADARGNLTYAKQAVMDISDREYFQAAMQRKTTISGPLTTPEGEDSIVLTVPMIRQGEVQERFALRLQPRLWALHLTITPIPRPRRRWSSPAGATHFLLCGMERYATIYEMLETMKLKSDDLVEQMRSEVLAGNSGTLTDYTGGQLRLLYYEPVGIQDWYICSLVVMDAHEKILQEMSASAFGVLAAILLIVILLAATGVYLILYFQRRVKEAQKDPLTGVYTRLMAQRQASRILKENRHTLCACLFIDVDDFKTINDHYGHDEGDRVLISVSRVLRESVRSHDIVSRYGGDEFTVWLNNLKQEQEARDIAQRFLTRIDQQTTVHIRRRIVMVSPQERDYEAVLKRADQALYQAKQKGKNQICLIPAAPEEENL
ncbi:MAG: diguanylate cyclase domain-containing protein [Holdemania massiliensis]